MVFSNYVKRRILFFANQGLRPLTIAAVLQKEGVVVSRQGVRGFLARVNEVGLGRKAGSGRAKKRSAVVKAIVKSAMRSDDETTAKELRQKLSIAGHRLSVTTSWRCRKELGWTTRRTAYCQMVRQANKAKRLEWAHAHLHETEAEAGFSDIIFTDETSVQLESHRRFSCRKTGERPKNKPRYI